jgi:hypothetical protein
MSETIPDVRDEVLSSDVVADVGDVAIGCDAATREELVALDDDAAQRLSARRMLAHAEASILAWRREFPGL